MLTNKLRSLLEEYQRNKWFSQKNDDGYGEFVDYISGEMIHDLVESWKQKKDPALIYVAYYLYRVIPPIKYRDLHNENSAAFADTLSEQKIKPAFLFYYLRSLPEAQAEEIWQRSKNWAVKWRTPMSNWLDARLHLQQNYPELERAHFEVIGVQQDLEINALERNLVTSRELFDWIFKKRTSSSNLLQTLQYFRLSSYDDAEEWNAFPSLAKSIAEAGHFHKLPKLRNNEQEDAIQFLFPVDPPRRLVMEFGKAAGVWDSVRFLFQLGKAFFYSGLNPDLNVENRICGDPTLPLFWGYLYSNLFASSSGLQQFVSTQTTDLAENISMITQFWIRYDAAIAIYRSRIGIDLKEARDLYVSSFESAFLMNTPDFLDLYDLERSDESLFRVLAYRSALAAEERLRSLYGNQWFSSLKCSKRIQEYWRHGFQTTLQQIMQDLGASPDPDFFLKIKG